MAGAGSPYAAFRRAIEACNLTRAITEARDLPQISLADAAELVVLAADDHGRSFDRWAGRWAARYVLEERNVTLGEAQLVLAGPTVRIDLSCALATGLAVSHQRIPPFISRSQAYYWSRAWQEGEAEALAEIAAGEGRLFSDPHELARYLLSNDDD